MYPIIQSFITHASTKASTSETLIVSSERDEMRGNEGDFYLLSSDLNRVSPLHFQMSFTVQHSLNTDETPAALHN